MSVCRSENSATDKCGHVHQGKGGPGHHEPAVPEHYQLRGDQDQFVRKEVSDKVKE